MRTPAVTLAVVAVASTSLIAACGFIENDRSLRSPITTTTEVGKTTLPPGPKTPVSSTDVCNYVDQQLLTSVAVDASISPGEDMSGVYTLQTTGNEAACRWYLRDQTGTYSLLVAVATGVGSDAFELALAAPGVGDPFTVDGLGDMAAAVTERAGLRSNQGTSYVLVLAYGKLLKIESMNALLVDAGQLEQMARALLPKLA